VAVGWEGEPEGKWFRASGDVTGRENGERRDLGGGEIGRKEGRGSGYFHGFLRGITGKHGPRWKTEFSEEWETGNVSWKEVGRTMANVY